jgi:hypothetical protein
MNDSNNTQGSGESNRAKQVRLWIEEEYALLHVEETEQDFSSWGGGFLALQHAVVDRLLDKHGDEISHAEQYNDLRQLIFVWWIEIASAEQLRAYATYQRTIAKQCTRNFSDEQLLISQASTFETLAAMRAAASNANANN